MKSAIPEVNELHKTYQELTGHDIALRFDREYAWQRFLREGFTRDDLVLVIRHLRVGINKGERNEGCLRFRNLIDALDYFEEELAMARKRFRPARPATRPQSVSGGGVNRVIDMPASHPEKLAPEAVVSALDDLKSRIQTRREGGVA